MIQFLDDGSTTIDFPNGPVTVKPPTFGGLKRLRAERVKLARQAQDQMVAWDAEHPAPEADGDTPPDPLTIARHLEDRVVAQEEANLATAEQWWRLALVGDGTFQGLADGQVPEQSDDWPAALLYDIRPVLPPLADGQKYSTETLLSLQSMPDQWMRHVGNGRSRYGHGAVAGNTATSS